MIKVAFYIMNQKGLYVLSKFISKYGSEGISYVVSDKDKNLANDPFDLIKNLSIENKIIFFSREVLDTKIEKRFEGYKFSIGWRWLINSKKLVVFHDSLLPKYRGFAPLVNSLINGEKKGGVTALFANSKYDEGNIIAQKSIEFTYPLKIEDAINKIKPLYSDLVCEIYEMLIAGEPIRNTVQNHPQATYSLWLDQEDYFINWKWSATKIKRFVDAVGFPYDGAKAKINTDVVIFTDVEVVEDVYIEHRTRHLGKVIFIDEFPVVVCATGLLKVLKVLNKDGQIMRINFRTRFK